MNDGDKIFLGCALLVLGFVVVTRGGVKFKMAAEFALSTVEEYSGDTWEWVDWQGRPRRVTLNRG